MRRITPDEVKAAYERHPDIAPCLDSYARFAWENGEACVSEADPLTIVAIDEGLALSLDDDVEELVVGRLGLDRYYADRFVEAVNGHVGPADLGSIDGQAVREAVFLDP